MWDCDLGEGESRFPVRIYCFYAMACVYGVSSLVEALSSHIPVAFSVLTRYKTVAEMKFSFLALG